MPVIFTPKERDEISQKIRETALRLFETKGIRKTTVSEITKAVGIAKGTFYNFYESKGALVYAIIDEMNQKAEAEVFEKLKARGKIPVQDFFEVYTKLFRPEMVFSYHMSVDDVEWMKTTEETKIFFDPEKGKQEAKQVLSYVTGIRDDIDYGYVVNFPKMVNMMIEQRESFCQDAFDKNVRAVWELLLAYLTEGKGENT